MQSEMFPSWLSPKAPAAASSTFPFALRARAVAVDVAPRTKNASNIEILDYEAAGAFVREWANLADRALEPNVFAEPACALAAAQHLTGGHRPRFLFVWEGKEHRGPGDLVAICPLHVPGRFEARGFLQSWTHAQAPLGTPLIDASRAREALETIVRHCARERPEAAGIVFRSLPRHGKTADLLHAFGRKTGCFLEPRPADSLALLRIDRDRQGLLLGAPGLGARENFGRMRRDLERAGPVSFQRFHHPSDVRFAAEEFLALDAAAARNPSMALLGRPEIATFTRCLTRTLAAQGKCSIDRMAVGGETIAMGIAIRGGDRDYLWRVACSSRWAPYALQAQLVLAVGRANPGGPPLTLADARDFQPSAEILRTWTEEIPLVDIPIAFAPHRSHVFANAMRRDAARRKLGQSIGGALSRDVRRGG